nr:ribosomal protein S19 [Actinophrys sol]
MTKYVRLLRHERIERLKFKYVDPMLLADLKSGDPIVRTMSRSSTITPLFIGKKIAIYNGKKYFSFEVTEDFLGHKLGEFIFTRKFLGHKKHGKKLVIKKKIRQNKIPFKSQSRIAHPTHLFEIKKYLSKIPEASSMLIAEKTKSSISKASSLLVTQKTKKVETKKVGTKKVETKNKIKK